MGLALFGAGSSAQTLSCGVGNEGAQYCAGSSQCVCEFVDYNTVTGRDAHHAWACEPAPACDTDGGIDYLDSGYDRSSTIFYGTRRGHRTRRPREPYEPYQFPVEEPGKAIIRALPGEPRAAPGTQGGVPRARGGDQEK